MCQRVEDCENVRRRHEQQRNDPAIAERLGQCRVEVLAGNEGESASLETRDESVSAIEYTYKPAAPVMP